MEKKQNAEVSTPWKLRQEMLAQIPEEFWKSPKKVFEPCAGKGGFLLDILEKFMDGLQDFISDEKERKAFILENCIYWADINPVNIFICNLFLNSKENLKLNYWEGDTLKLDLQKQWDLESFDAVIGNPPYNNIQVNTGKKGGGDLLWNKFVVWSLERLSSFGYLVFVHPSGWRKPPADKSKYSKLFALMAHDNHMKYLEIHDTKDGKKTFNCGTRYDWYVIEKNQERKETLVKFQDGVIESVDLRELEFLPNQNINLVKKLLAIQEDEKCKIIYNRTNYGYDKT